MFRTWLLLLGLIVSVAGQPMAACHSITLTGELQSGDHFEKVIGGELVFRLEPERLGRDGELHGWRINLAPLHEPDRDYIYPVNPPLRFNGLQILGPSYGDDTKTSLAHPHEMRFLLDRADYEYVGALETLVMGQLKFTMRAYDPDPVNGSIRRIKFQAEFTTPGNFKLDQALKPKPAVCPI